MFGFAYLRLQAIQYRFVARYEGQRDSTLLLVAVIVAREPVLVAVDVEAVGKTVLRKNTATGRLIIQK